ncbi:MAG: rhodanese-like domain-containing protein, partial [Acinetobacter sp.]|nr:rhodanese-like domain-containing protein [Acinetobacter sp.]
MQPYLDLLIEAEHVASLDLNDTQRYRVVDLCRASVYRQVHLPNAIHLMPKQLVAQRNDATGVLPDVAQLQALIEQLQLTAQHHVLVYDDEGGGWASRLIWTLHCLGFEQVSLINGGLHACLAAGIAMTNEIPQ